MAKLENIVVGSLVDGVANGETVQVVAVKWFGSDVLEVTFKNAAGLLASQLLYRDNEIDSKVMEIRAEMERIEAHKLQPHFIEAFFVEAFKNVGGKIHRREHGRYEITSVPFAVRNRDMQIGFGESVLSRYERICFDKANCNVPGLVPAALVCPGHPLLEATIDLVREAYI